jgi:hypothetical protein
MIILNIDIAISKTNTIISEIDNGHVYDLTHARFYLICSSELIRKQNFNKFYLQPKKVFCCSIFDACPAFLLYYFTLFVRPESPKGTVSVILRLFTFLRPP